MENSVSKLEDFSVEVFLEIFDYLSIDDCFHAFDQLHWKVNLALKTAAFAVNLSSISSRTYSQLYEHQIFSQHTRQIRKLQISNELTFGLIERFFHRIDLRDFHQLRSLILIKPTYMTLNTLALFIPQLKQLKHVSIETNSYPEHFFQTITSESSSIKSCYFLGLEIEDPIEFQSKIESLTVTLEDITILLTLLANFKQLKYLQVTLRSTIDSEEHSLPILDQRIDCGNLEKLDLYLLQRSAIDFNEIEYFFGEVSFPRLKSFSYNCITNSLNHLHVSSWNEILSKSLSTINKFNLFVQIPSNTYSYTDIQQIRLDLQTNLLHSLSISLALHSSYYIIHTNIYPRTHLELAMNLSELDSLMNYDPITSLNDNQYSKVNSLILSSHLISSCTIIPKSIEHLHIQDSNDQIDFHHCFQGCAEKLSSLKIVGLPDRLPCLSNLRQLTIQQTMFNVHMAMKLSTQCPLLELLTMEINCIEQFTEIFTQLRSRSNLTQLKFVRIFSRDPTETWTSWLQTHHPFDDQIQYEVKNAFLFLWF